MAFTMTHLIIAKNISEIFANHIKSLPQFYLGSIAPDAVHYRDDYNSDYKKASHLNTSADKWGMMTDYDDWESNIIAFLNKHKNSENRDFILGYCTHVLTDLYNTINVWTPFRLKNSVDLENDYLGNLHHHESNKLDIELALAYEGREEFWANLANSTAIDLPSFVSAEEINKHKDSILNSWYKDKERQDLSANKIRTYEGELDFIEKTTEYVKLIFQEHFLTA